MVSALFTYVPRSRGAAGRAGPARRSRHGVAMGTALRPGNGTTFAPATQTDQRQLAGGRDLHPGQGQVALPVSVDSTGATLDFLLSAKQDAVAAKRFLAKALGRQNHPMPRVINTDKDAAYPPAIVQLKAEGALEENCRHRPVQYLNNVLEQDHRAIKRRVNASQHFRSFWGAWRTIAGYEAIHKIRKGQACWNAAGAKVGLMHRFIVGMFGLEV